MDRFRSGLTTFPWIWRKLRNWFSLSSASTTTLIRPSSRRTESVRLPRSAGPHRPADDLRPERGVALPVGPLLGPAPAGVGGEGDGAAQAVGPVGQERVDLPGRQRRGERDLDQLVLLDRGQHQPGDRRDVRGEAGDRLAQVVDLGGPGCLLLEDQGARDRPRFLLVDPRQGLGVGDVVEPPLGLGGEVPHHAERARVVAVGGGEDGGHGDLVGGELVDHRGGRGRRVAVADDDDVPGHRVLDVEQALHRHLERGVEVGHVAGRHPVDRAEHRRFARSRSAGG